MATKLVPLFDRIVVERSEQENKIGGGLTLPAGSKERPQRGVVIAIGDGVTDAHGVLHPPQVKPGDKVLFGKYAGNEISFDGKLMLVMREEEIFLIERDVPGDGKNG